MYKVTEFIVHNSCKRSLASLKDIFDNSIKIQTTLKVYLGPAKRGDLIGHKGQRRVTLTERSREKVKQHLTLEVVV